MVISRDEPTSSQQNPQLLLGVVIDVSHSMQNSWRNKDGKNIPRIEVVRDVLNKKIRDLQQSQTQKGNINNIEVFCLGIGFRYPLYIKRDLQSCEQDQVMQSEEKTEVVDLICDLLALCEILPTPEELFDFKERLNQKWHQCTGHIFERATIREDAFGQLYEYVQNTLYESAMEKHHRSVLYNFSHQKLATNIQWISNSLAGYIQRKENSISDTSKSAAKKYANDILERYA